MRRLHGLIAAVLLSAPAAAFAGVTLDGGFCLPPHLGDPWMEVWADVENGDSAEFRGTLQVEMPLYRSRGPGASRDIAVAPGAKKRFFLVIAGCPGLRPTVELSLQGKNGLEVAHDSATSPWLSATEKALVVVSRPEAPSPFLLAIPERRLAATWRRYEADVSHLPEHREGWASAGLVAIAGADMATWSEEQRRALLGWVELGGQVLFLPGTDMKWLESPGVQALTRSGGVSVEDTDTWPSPYFGNDGPRVVFSFERPGRPIARSAGNATCSWDVGRGRVGVVAFDSSLPSLALVNYGMERFAMDTLDALKPQPSIWSFYNEERAIYEWKPFQDALGKNLVGYPATGWILVLLVVYVVAIGPLNFWLLRRRHAPAMTVVTIPAVGILATALLFTVGWILRDSRLQANRVTVIRLDPDSDMSESREHVVVVAGKRRVAILESALGRLAEMTDGRNEVRREVKFGGPAGEALVRPFEPNEPAFFYTLGRRKVGTLHATLEVRTGTLTIENKTGLAIRHLFLLDGGVMSDDMGEIADGKGYTGPSHLSAEAVTLDPTDDTPERWLARTLDPKFLTVDESVLIALVDGASPPPVVDGKPREPKMDVTILIAPVERIGLSPHKRPK